MKTKYPLISGKSFSIILFLSLTILTSCGQGKYISYSEQDILNKVRGGWAAKMIGVQYGASMEFQATGKIYEGDIPWKPEMVEGSLKQDDIYGQLNFMMTFEANGLNVAVDSLARDFAYAKFPLCHANLQARKNYFDGVPVQNLAYPENSIHAEDIDFQIESDFIGFINPVMPQSSNELAQKVGSIMAYGDGLYGGMFLAAMNSLAYKYNNVEIIVDEALKAIPENSTYAQCIRDAIAGHKENPNDWKATWKALEDKWGKYDVCTPYIPFNIDAKINGAYVVMGLLYGGGDLEKTMDITIRGGQDTDCNSSNAAAVLGIMHGYNAIPDHLKSHIRQIEEKPFLHTTYSYKKAIDQSMTFIRENIINNGGKIKGQTFYIAEQKPKAPALQKGFGEIRMLYNQPVKEIDKWRFDENWVNFAYNIGGDNEPYKVAMKPGATMEVDFRGTGISLLGSWNVDCGKAKIYIDNQFVKEIDTYYREEAGLYDGNRAYLFHKLGLFNGKHTLKLVVSEEKNLASSGHKVYIQRLIAYK